MPHQPAMKILLSAFACRPNAGSEPGNGWNWATYLAARGLEVHVLTAERYREQIEPTLAANPIHNLGFSYVHVPQVLKRGSEAIHYIFWQRYALTVAKKLLRQTPFVLAHHVTYGSVHVPSQLWRLGIPLIFGPVGGGQTAPPAMLKYFDDHKRKEQIRTACTHALRLSPLHRRWLRQMSIVFVANRDTLRVVQGQGCKRAILMSDAGLPESFFAPEPRRFQESNCPIRLLWVGRMLPRKALPLALDALARVRRPVSLTIVGDGLDPSYVKQMIDERKLVDRVTWQGRRLPWNEVRTSYLEHDALLFTSLRDTFACQLLEAMATGLPVITLDLHGAHDYVPEDAGLKVPVSTPDETVQNIANAIETYAGLPVQERNDMSHAAWRFAQDFEWSARAKVMEGMYRAVLANTVDFRNVAPCFTNARVSRTQPEECPILSGRS